MDIAQYIAELLQENDEVSVPGIGTFYKKTFSASFDPDSNTYLPPRKTLSFTSEEKNTAILVQYISAVKNLSEPSARYFAEKFGETIKADLENAGKANLSPLGSLKKNSSYYSFIAAPAYEANDFYGLEATNELEVDFPEQENQDPLVTERGELQDANEENNIAAPLTDNTPLTEEKFEVVIPEPSKPEAAEHPVKETYFENAPSYTAKSNGLEDDELLDDEPKVKRKKRWPVVLIVINILLILAVVLYINYPEYVDKILQPGQNAQAVKKARPVQQPIADTTTTLADSLSRADSIMNGLQENGNVEVTKVPDTITNVTTEITTITPKDVTTYEIIGASLPTRIEAERYIRQMKAKGIDAKIVEAKKGRLIKVSLGSFTNKAKADVELARIQKEITKNAWPLKITNKEK